MGRKEQVEAICAIPIFFSRGDDDKRLSLKVWIDEANMRVVLAEACEDFIDVLFSFMTLSLGTFVKLLSKNSRLGSIDNLYDSIEKLDDKHWRTMTCKNMVLNHCSVALEPCKNHISSSQRHYSSVRDRICYRCGEVIDEAGLLEKVGTIEYDGVFVKKNNTHYIITDDFHVKPCSFLHYYDILKEHGVGGEYSERTLKFGRPELLYLLETLLQEKEVLTKIVFRGVRIRSTTPKYNDEMDIKVFEREDNAQIETNKLHIKLIMNRTNNNVVCAEIGEDLTNQLFSFLTVPLGYVLRLIGYSKSLGCLNNLYNSIQELNINCFKNEETKNMLISTQLPTSMGYYKQMLNIYDHFPDVVHYMNCCQKCLDNINMIKHGMEESYFKQIDPKFPMTNLYSNEGLVRTTNFLITADCRVTPMSFSSVTQIMHMSGLHVDHLEKTEMSIGKAQVVNLLKLMLVSKTVLSDALIYCVK